MSQKIILKELFPPIPSSGEMFMLEAMTYKVMLQASPLADIPTRDLIVEAWTNQCDDDNANGEWHAVRLNHLKTDTSTDCVTFGSSIIITSDRDFEFIFRAKIQSEKNIREDYKIQNDASGEPKLQNDPHLDANTHNNPLADNIQNKADDNAYTWFGSDQEKGCVKLAPPREKDAWTQGPNFTHILGGVHCGNFIATTRAKELGFTHVLNVAENLDVIYAPGEEVVYRKVGMTDGGHNPIAPGLLDEAVAWLREVDQGEVEGVKGVMEADVERVKVMREAEVEGVKGVREVDQGEVEGVKGVREVDQGEVEGVKGVREGLEAVDRGDEGREVEEVNQPLAQALDQSPDQPPHQPPSRNRILVNCRAGIGRAGSTVIAYVFATNRKWSYEQCRKFVADKRYVYPHRNLKETLYELYPRET